MEYIQPKKNPVAFTAVLVLNLVARDQLTLNGPKFLPRAGTIIVSAAVCKTRLARSLQLKLSFNEREQT